MLEPRLPPEIFWIWDRRSRSPGTEAPPKHDPTARSGFCEAASRCGSGRSRRNAILEEPVVRGARAGCRGQPRLGSPKTGQASCALSAPAASLCLLSEQSRSLKSPLKRTKKERGLECPGCELRAGPPDLVAPDVVRAQVTDATYLEPSQIAMYMTPQVRRIAVLLSKIPRNAVVRIKRPEGYWHHEYTARIVEVLEDKNIVTFLDPQGTHPMVPVPLDRITTVYEDWDPQTNAKFWSICFEPWNTPPPPRPLPTSS